MKIIECKRVDLWDGGEHQKFGLYIDPTVPTSKIKEAFTGCYVHPVRPLVIFASIEEYKDHKHIDLRKSAWDKLTPLEREALGLTNPFGEK